MKSLLVCCTNVPVVCSQMQSTTWAHLSASWCSHTSGSRVRCKAAQTAAVASSINAGSSPTAVLSARVGWESVLSKDPAISCRDLGSCASSLPPATYGAKHTAVVLQLHLPPLFPPAPIPLKLSYLESEGEVHRQIPSLNVRGVGKASAEVRELQEVGGEGQAGG
jgi:hypothetical protein